MTLTPDQIKTIRYHIDKSEITITSLGDDLLDHICCLVEKKMEQGGSFEDSLNKSLNELAPDGLYELERETILLLHSKNILMKKFIYLIGLCITMTMTIGLLFRILHWPGGPELFNYGFIGFCLFFIPIVAYNHFKIPIYRTLPEKLRMASGVLSALIIGLAVSLKILHVFGADIMLLGGIGIFTFCFLPVLFYTLYKKEVN